MAIYTKEAYRVELRAAARHLGLYSAAKWYYTIPKTQGPLTLTLLLLLAGRPRCSSAASGAGEQQKEEEIIELEGSLGKSNAVNQELVALERELSTHRRTGAIDSFSSYLYGIVLRDKGSEALASTVLVESVNSYPWNWSAWLELQSLCTSNDILNNLNLKNQWMKDFFLASGHLELKMHEEALKRYERLMGYERPSEADVELKNTPAAIDAYRRTVDINPRDYRAWYGLGQICEMMGMSFYALHYFCKSSYLQPNDARLWNAMAQCYESDQLQMIEEAIKCYERSANHNGTEGIALHELAKLHGMLGQSEEAAFFYKKDLESGTLQELGRFEEAEHYYTRLLDYTSPSTHGQRELVITHPAPGKEKKSIKATHLKKLVVLLSLYQ
uniref:Cdc23 domain-containing protein n=2 Tax=Oryza punctata TaxID=4537 RepID=A0A0E0KY96_ORYPU